jgi:hypothetical protein
MLKRAVWEGLDLPLSEGLELEQRLAKRLMLMTANDNRTRANRRRSHSRKSAAPGRNRVL